MLQSSKLKVSPRGQCISRTFHRCRKFYRVAMLSTDYSSPGLPQPLLTEIPLRCSETNPLTRMKIL